MPEKLSPKEYAVYEEDFVSVSGGTGRLIGKDQLVKLLSKQLGRELSEAEGECKGFNFDQEGKLSLHAYICHIVNGMYYTPRERRYARLLLRPDGTFAYVHN